MKYPDEVDRLIWLVKQESIPRDKVKRRDCQPVAELALAGQVCCAVASPFSLRSSLC